MIFHFSVVFFYFFLNRRVLIINICSCNCRVLLPSSFIINFALFMVHFNYWAFCKALWFHWNSIFHSILMGKTLENIAFPTFQFQRSILKQKILKIYNNIVSTGSMSLRALSRSFVNFKKVFQQISIKISDKLCHVFSSKLSFWKIYYVHAEKIKISKNLLNEQIVLRSIK